MQRLSSNKRIFILIVLSILGLELILQLFSYFWVTERRFFFGVDRRDHHIDFEALRIVTLGESTTDNRYYGQNGKAWPEHLEQFILDKGIAVKVYNLGQPAITTNELMLELPSILDHYRPDIVISMIGVNDSNRWSVHLSDHSFKKIKIYRILSWLYFALKSPKIPPPKITVEMKGDWTTSPYASLAESRDEDRLKELPVELRAQMAAFWVRSSYDRIENVRNEMRKGLTDAYQKLFEQNIFVENTLGDYTWLLCHQGRYDDCREVFSQYTEQGGKLNHFELMNAQCCARNAAEWTDILRANDKDMFFFYQENAAYDNYRHIANLIKQYGALHVVMQYPTVEIDQLQRYLGNDRGIIYVENRKNFLQALEQYETEEIFTDLFARDFGHTTDLGHRLIATNLFEAIKDKIRVLVKKERK